MPQFIDPNAMGWDTVEVPLSAGVDTRSPARTVRPPSLLKAENLRFDSGQSLRKRRGHVGHKVRDTTRLDLDQLQGSWLYGWGVAGSDVSGVTGSPGPDAGKVAGLAKRDNETLVWDGWHLFSYPAGVPKGDGWQTPVTAYLPTAYTTPIAKAQVAQTEADIAIAEKLAVVVYKDPRSGDNARVSVYDSVTWAPYLIDHLVNIGGTACYSVRAVPCGESVNILVADDGDTLHGFTIHPSAPGTLVPFVDAPGNSSRWFDVKKLSEEHWLLLKTGDDGYLYLTRYNAAFGTATAVYNTPITAGADAKATYCSVAQHPLTGEVAVVWADDVAFDTWHSRITDFSGVVEDSADVMVATSPVGKLTVEAQYRVSTGNGKFSAFVAQGDGDVAPYVSRYDFWNGNDPSTLGAKRFYADLASHAWRVGQELFVTLRRTVKDGAHALQYSYFPCDADLKPVGRLEYGTAPLDLRQPTGLFSVHADYGQDGRNNTKFHSLISRRERVDSTNNDQYDEESLKRVSYDFLPRLRGAQLGRSTYFPGAQLNQYDGANLYEAGFLVFPDDVQRSAGSAGALTGTYTYKVRWAYKTASGEEIQSATLALPSITVTTKKINLTIPTLGLTRKSGVYALVYRNENNGTNWYLVSNRDTSATGDNGCPINDPTAATVSFVDNLTDASLIAKEAEIIGNTGALELFAAPASQVIGVGRDRLWLAGGELPPGDILPSLTFQSGRAVQFNQFIQTTVDRQNDAVTAFGFLGNSSLVFKRDRIYAFEADGPNNLGSGGFDVPRVISTESGAQSQESLVLASEGLYFQGPGHIALLAFNYQIVDVGLAVRNESGHMTVAAGVILPTEQEIRFYSATDDYPTLVYNLRYREWTTWTGLTAAGALATNFGAGDVACVGIPDGRLFVETDGTWVDDGAGIPVTWKTAWLYAEHLQGFQKVRHIIALGDFLGAHVLRIRAFYDDRDYPESTCYWSPLGSGDLNDDTWGASNWGDGIWGDTEGNSGTARPRDQVLQVRHGLRRQKCSRVCFEITDGGARSEGPALTALALEIGRRGGLSRVSRTVVGSADGSGGGAIPNAGGSSGHGLG